MRSGKCITKQDFIWSIFSYSQTGYGNIVHLLKFFVFNPLKVMHVFLDALKSPPEVSQ